MRETRWVDHTRSVEYRTVYDTANGYILICLGMKYVGQNMTEKMKFYYPSPKPVVQYPLIKIELLQNSSYIDLFSS